jgi:WD40 repeat protein
VTFSADGRTLASGSLDGTVRLWDPLTGKERATFVVPGNKIVAVAFSPDSRTLAAAGSDQKVRLWRAAGR